MEVGSLTDTGIVRHFNEDSYHVDENKGIFIVADGMGGHQAGDVASQIVVTSVVNSLTQKFKVDTQNDNQTEEKYFQLMIGEALHAANKEVFLTAANDASKRGMGSTATLALINDNRVYIGQIGDSRAYHITGTKIIQLTKDQSLLQTLIDSGDLTPEQARNDDRKNIIMQAVGTKESIKIDFYKKEFSKDEWLVLCSDGLTGMVEDKRIWEIVTKETKTPQEACEKLVKEANASGGKDNVTVIIAKFTKQPQPNGERHESLIGRIKKIIFKK